MSTKKYIYKIIIFTLVLLMLYPFATAFMKYREFGFESSSIIRTTSDEECRLLVDALVLKYGARNIEKYLKKDLKSNEFEERLHSLDVLYRILKHETTLKSGSRDGLEMVMLSLRNDSNQLVRTQFVAYYADLFRDHCVPVVKELLLDNSYHVKRAAALMLAHFGDNQGVLALIELIDEEQISTGDNDVVQQLTRITGETYKTKDEWVRWSEDK